MAWWNSLWSAGAHERESITPSTTTTLQELEQDGYELVEVHDEPGKQFAVAAPVGDMHREIGTTSPSPWTSFTRQEYNPKLRGLQGYEKYDRMRKSDGTVRGTLRAVKTPVLSARWFIEPGGDKNIDKQAAELVADALFSDNMSISWTQILTESLLMLDFGYYMFEKVWETKLVNGKWRTTLAKLAPRHPMDVKEWVFDAHGGPRGVWMYSPSTNILNDDVFIPIEKLLVFTFDREAGNIEGISVLRSAYKHWYYKEQLYKIDAIQKERHGIGIPVIKLPMGYKPEDKAAADNLGRNIRTNERAHITLPPGWDIAMLKLEGNPVDALDSIEHHDAAIRENILVNFIRDGAREEDLVMFYKAIRFVADIVADTFNCYLVPQLVGLNFSRAAMPKVKVRRVGETADWRTLSFAIRNLIGSGVIVPDRALEDNLRSEMDLPQVDEETARLIATPQNPYDPNDEVEEIPGANSSGQDSSGSNTRNNNNPNYRRKPRRRPLGARRNNAGSNGFGKGLPRQTTMNRAQNSFGLPSRGAGRDATGGN